MTGHPVSHETALPDRFAPYTSPYDAPLRSSSRPNAARRRRISTAENSSAWPGDITESSTTARPARNRMPPRRGPGYPG